MPRSIPASAGPLAHLEAPPRARVPAPRGGRSGHPRRTAVRSPLWPPAPACFPYESGLKCRTPGVEVQRSCVPAGLQSLDR
eukprot:12155815-Alexandrium_andersonii.AAC.1